MAQTYTWIGNSGSAEPADSASNWLPSGGPPNTGDSAIVNAGTVVLTPDAQLNQNTIFLESATLVFTGETATNLGTPTLDSNSLITTDVAPAETAPTSPQQTVLDAYGTFINDGTIQADGYSGSSFTILIAGTTIGGTYYPGYFLNQSAIEVDAGNSMTISVAGTSELFNASQMTANGGTLVINAASSATAGGYAPIVGFALIEGGGTVETNVSYASTISGTAPFFGFEDTTTGNTLKIDNVAQFGGRIFAFQSGDTIDLGATLSVSKAVYSSTTGILALENSGGTILASLDFATGGFQSATFTVNSTTGAIGTSGFTVGTGVDGNTILTTSVTIPSWNNTSGTWQTAANWSGGAVPGALDTPLIGLGQNLAFTLTTGSSPVSVDGLTMIGHQGVLQITSATTVGSYGVGAIEGTIEVTAGQTLTAPSLREFFARATVLLDSGALLDLTGHPNVALAANAGSIAINSGNTFALGLDGGSLLVNGATINAGPQGTVGSGGNIVIGYDGAGSPAVVTVQAAGVVKDTYALLSSDPTSFGSLTVSGGSTWTDYLDPNDTTTTRGYMMVGNNNEAANTPSGVTTPPYSGVAQLLIDSATVTEQSYGIIGNSVDSAGSVTVQNGGLWNINATGSGFLQVGKFGSGALSVLAGSTVEVGSNGNFVTNGTTTTGGGISIGVSVGATGSVTVSGAGAMLSSATGIAVGRAGYGVLDVVNGGTVSLAAGGLTVAVSAVAVTDTLTVGGTGSAAVVNLGSTAGGLTVAQSGTGLAQVLAGGAITLSGTGGISIGQSSGAVGTLLISGGTVIENASSKGVGIGQSLGATGLLEVTNGSFIQGTSSNGIGVGQSGSGTLEVLNNGTVSVVGGLAVAGTAGGSGSVQVSGGGALLQVTGTNALSVGAAGTGIMTIGNLGQVTTAAGINVGFVTGSHGTLTVTGGSLTDNAGLSIGSNGTGAVTIGSGGLITLSGTTGQQVFVGNLNGSGSIDVNGGQFTVSNGGLVVGGSGNASVTVENAGTATFTNTSSAVSMDVNGSHAATITVTGTNSLLQLSGPVIIGDNAAGAVSVSTGATLDAGTSNINLGNQTGGAGTLTVSGGGATLKAGSLNIGNSSFSSSGNLTLGAGGSATLGTLSVAGALTMNGGSLNATSQISFQTGGTISGFGTLNTPQLSGGTITASGGLLEVTGGTIGFSGGFHIASGSSLWLDSATDSVSVPSVFFDNGTTVETLILGTPQVNDGLAISNWQNHDLLEFSNGATVTSAGMQNGNTLVVGVTGVGGVSSYSFTNVGLAPSTSPVFTFGSDIATGNNFVELISCFAPGTLIRTERGDVPVELLTDRDTVVTASGTTRPVQWIGHRRIDLARHPAPELAQPIRICADAIADGIPARDIRLSPDHAVLLDGKLVPVRLLLNGASITQETDCWEITYFHVELDAHDVLLAENMPAESYLDTGNRVMFDNAAGPLLLHPFCTNDQARREAESCAPLATDTAWTERVWRRLAMRATQLGLDLADDPHTSDDPELCIVADGRRLAPVRVQEDRYVFVLPSGCRNVALISRTALANNLRPWLEDRRCLGVMLRSLVLRSGGTSVAVPLDHPSLREGWWAPEWHDAATLRRWTNGRAVLPGWWMAGLAGPVIVEVGLADVMHYATPAEVAVAA